MSDEKALPCPFCGKEAHTEYAPWIGVSVWCDNSGCRNKSSMTVPEWNRRTPSPSREDGPCHFCGEQTESMSGNPSRWPVVFCHSDDSGVPKVHHAGCLAERVTAFREDLARDAVVEVVRRQHAGHKKRWLSVRGRVESQFNCANCASLESLDALRSSPPTHKPSRKLKDCDTGRKNSP